MPSDSRRPRTRLNLKQLRILVEAFERNPMPGFATRKEQGQRTGLPEDTIHIWFQNRRAWHLRARDQDVPASQVQDVAAVGLGVRDDEAAQDILLPLAAAGGAGMENSSSSDQPNFNKGSQQPQVTQPKGPSQAETATQAISKALWNSSLINCWEKTNGRPRACPSGSGWKVWWKGARACPVNLPATGCPELCGRGNLEF